MTELSLIAFLDKNLIALAIIVILFIIIIVAVLRVLNLSFSASKNGIKITPKGWDFLTEYIGNVVNLSVEKATAKDRIRDDGRRIVKNSVDQSIILMNQLELECRCETFSGCADRDFYYESITSGKVKDYLVAESMEIIERNHIAEMTDPEWRIKTQNHFERFFTGAEAIVEAAWIDEAFDVKIVRKKMRDNIHKFSKIFDILMGDIRELAIKYAKRNEEIDRMICDANKEIKGKK